MALAPKRWLLRPPAPAAFIAALADYGPLLATLLYQRGLTSREEVDAFLGESYPLGLHNPFELKDMQRAAQRVAQAIAQGEPMAVYGDFDTDGVTAVALLMRAIPAFGGQLRPYIPHRMREGYGLNLEAIEQLHAEGIRLLITVDCGVSNVAEVARAQALGMDVIVTDHHAPPATLPPAFALVNPKQADCGYPFKHLVGVGLAFKLVQALWKLGLRADLSGRDLLDVVALGTVTDMGPLHGENRVLVKAGLEALNHTSRPGLLALIEVAGLRLGSIDASAIGYTLGPRINAAGRLDDAVLAYDLLLAGDAGRARQLAQQLNEANRRRQELTQRVQSEAQAQAQVSGALAEQLVFLAGDDYPAGVVGLVAGRLADAWGRPVVLIDQSTATCRGSARSIPGFNIVAAFERCADLLLRYGGHAQAAGFSVERALLPALEQRLLAIAAEIGPNDLGASLRVDAELPLASLTWQLLDQLALLEPFGQENQRPILVSRAVPVLGSWAKGADQRTLKLRLGSAGFAIDAIGYRMGHLAADVQRLGRVDVAYQLEANEWNGERRLQLRLHDLRPAEKAPARDLC